MARSLVGYSDAARGWPALCVASMVLSAPALAQTSKDADTATQDKRIDDLTREVAELKELVQRLLKNYPDAAAVTTPAQANPAAASQPQSPPLATTPTQVNATIAGQVQGTTAAADPTAKSGLDLLHGMTVNVLLDGYYEYNTNDPVGRVNSLRAYDVSSNSFSLNQADVVVESAPDVSSGKRVGVRLDFQYGQATSTLQGNAANELRPDVYQAVFQAYGTYVAPVGQGLTLDFGKWASALGIEGNYTKDQFNYSRSYWFDYLPFYHMGLRAKYQVNDVLAVDYWIANGAQQSEDFNSYKDQLLGFVLTPSPSLSWTFNYYRGQEHPDVIYLTREPAGQTNLPVQQGSYVEPIANAPTGKLSITDTYVTWQVSKALTVAAEADYVEERLYSYSPNQHVTGGALYGAYQLTPKVAVAVRGEYLADVGGLYTGITQYLKEETFTIDYRPEDGFLVRGEVRRDQSNQPYFYGSSLGLLESSQPTIGLGLVWWFGQKQGAW